MAPSQKKYPCLVCEEDITAKSGAVECSFCEKWVHPKCGNISKAHLEILRSSKTTYWTCDPCDAVAGKIKKEIRHLQSTQDQMRKEMNTQINDLQIEQATQKTRMDVFDRQLEVMKKEKNNNEAVYKELRERDSRRENLVIHQIPEAGMSVKGKERREFDAKRAMDLFEFIGCSIRREDIKFIYRPGELKESDRPRPVILSLIDEGMKKRILANTRKLANSRFDRISIIPDLTPQQRKEEEDQRKEVSRLNLELDEEESLNWEWVLVGPRGRRRAIKRKKFDQSQRGEPVWGGRITGLRRGENQDGRERENTNTRNQTPQTSYFSREEVREEDMGREVVRDTARSSIRGNRGGRGSGSVRGGRKETARADPWEDLESAPSHNYSQQNAPSRNLPQQHAPSRNLESAPSHNYSQQNAPSRNLPQQHAPSRNFSQQSLIMSDETLLEEDYQDLYSRSPHRVEEQQTGGEKEKDSRQGKRTREEVSLSPPQQLNKKTTT